MFAGNVGSAQAVEVIVEVAVLLREVKHVQFIVFGQGSRWAWMREQVQALGLSNLHLLGRYPLETMPGLLQKADALLVTLSNEPIFAMTVPNKIQAYLAVGRPILASLNGEGARIIRESQAGLCTPAEDSQLLAAAVIQIYQMSVEDRIKMGANGRRYFESHFDHEMLVDNLVNHMNFITRLKGTVL
jgi:glycosyltransferase involved in cell wall biosynthesis